MRKWVMLFMCAMLAISVSGCVGYENVDAGEIMVLKRTLDPNKGKLELRNAGIQFYNAISWDHDYTYPTRSQTYEMTDAGSGSRRGVDERLEIKGREGRKAWISAYFRYHIDMSKVEELHLQVGPDYEQILIHPFVQKVAKNEATTFETFEVYAGDTRKTLQERIIDVLQHGEWESTTERDAKTGDATVTYTGERLPAQLTLRGIAFEDFGILDVDLEPEYEKLVQQKQDASEKENIAKKVTGQLVQEAEQEKAHAQADMNKRVVAAEAAKQEAVLAAEAEKQKRVLEADGKKLAMIAEAEGVVALGEAEAKRIRLKNEAYASAGGRIYAMVEVAEAWAKGNHKEFYMVPQGMDVKLFGRQFADSMKMLFGQEAGTEQPEPVNKN